MDESDDAALQYHSRSVTLPPAGRELMSKSPKSRAGTIIFCNPLSRQKIADERDSVI
jgi:hypothetical protein